ncbi:MAG: S9 family peptidase [Sphingomonadales bacterium]|nr:S9 family peptidase [Sphingomonadales bacterium]
MSSRLGLLAASALALSALCTAPAVAAPTATNPLIPRQALFGNPVKAGAQISPDGRMLSWLAPVNGVMNVWVAPVGKPAAAKAITAEQARPIRQYFWAPDGKSVLYVQDKGGDENFLLYSVDPVTGKERNLTPFTKTRVFLGGASTIHKDRILVGLNNRDPRYHDIYSLDLASGKLTEVLKNEGGYGGFTADNNLVIRLAQKANADGGQDYFRVENGKVEEKPFASTKLEDSLTTAPAGFTADGKTLYWIDSRGRNTAALIAQNVATGATSILAEDKRADIGGTLTNPTTGQVEAYSVEYLRDEWTAIDPAIKASLAFLKKNLRGDFAVTSRTDKDDMWVVGDDPVTAPGSVYLYDRKAGKLTKLFTPRPELVGAPLPAMYPRVIKSRDGLDLVSYLTLPYDSDANADGVPDKTVPLVLLVHGGPWGRDGYGSNRMHQWLSNRGYAVLSVNFRGSTGLGKDFIAAGNLQWGRKMQDDLDDAVDWAVAQKITSADKVAIIGGSYGGYATLAGMTFTPTRYACGVDIVGPSNLETLLKTIPPYWAPVVQQFHQRMGDPGTPEGLALLKERSPLYSADKIVRPLLIGQGANDPRVNQAESDQIVAAMKARNIPVTYVLFPDEGHGFARPANNIAFNAVAENFLAGCLGGRAEPVGGDVAKSSAKVLEGADAIPGLTAAAK